VLLYVLPSDSIGAGVEGGEGDSVDEVLIRRLDGFTGLCAGAGIVSGDLGQCVYSFFLCC